ncbi:cytochrome C556 [Roseibium aquae]|uniref:Cytochrome C556 n=1 Tax=Roseibium aquae TaxID=1323746 RepID=A0A916TK01_9HYPH|nr:cytochrome c [Roseibium aquae]GGB50488.1 cytochrome C556 [Roseibium aquae]
MRKVMLGLVAGAVVLGGPVVSVQAAGDPIAVRKAVMQSVGAAAGLGGGMMKGEIAYTPAAGKAAIASMNAAALSYGDFFPEGSESGGDTTAAAAIWEDRAGFAQELAKFASATGGAMQASGKDGPADLDAFKAAFGPVLQTCKSCHEGFRVKR